MLIMFAITGHEYKNLNLTSRIFSVVFLFSLFLFIARFLGTCARELKKVN